MMLFAIAAYERGDPVCKHSDEGLVALIQVLCSGQRPEHVCKIVLEQLEKHGPLPPVRILH